jgi:hypothetical protein
MNHDIAGMVGDPEKAPEGGAGHLHHGDKGVPTID